MRFKEIETKYKASHIKLSEFIEFANSSFPLRKLDASSYDHYFVGSNDTFVRYRAGNDPELTLKKKTNKDNNFIREEINLPIKKLNSQEPQDTTVEAFCNTLGFFHNFTIYKVCSIFYYDGYNLVYYVVYDDNMKESSRFIEIEMDESKDWKTDTIAWKKLELIEKSLEELGISSKDRIKESLFELYRKI